MVAWNGQASRRGSACLSSLPARRAKSQTRLAEGPWKEISIDHLYVSSGEHLLVVVDYYSHWIEVIILKKTDAHHVVKSMEAIFRTHGLPECVRSDNGPPLSIGKPATNCTLSGSQIFQGKKKLDFFRACIESILLHGSETCTMKKDLQDHLDGTYTRLLMRAENISWREHKTKAKIYDGISQISSILAQRQARFAGHCY